MVVREEPGRPDHGAAGSYLIGTCERPVLRRFHRVGGIYDSFPWRMEIRRARSVDPACYQTCHFLLSMPLPLSDVSLSNLSYSAKALQSLPNMVPTRNIAVYLLKGPNAQPQLFSFL